MTRSRPITFLLSAAALPLTALAVAACGGGGAATASPAPTPTASQPATTRTPDALRVVKSRLGKILVNAQGRTLYLFKADVGTKSACTGACAAAWPPLLAKGNPTAGSGANQSLIGTTTRADGSRQVTYNGHPLYLFIKDKKPGQTTGQGVVAFGAAWFVLSPAGKQISSHKPGHSSSASPAAAQSAPQPAASPAQPAPKPAAPPAAQPAPKPAAPPAAKPNPPANNGIPQNGGGDGDSDNSGGPSDGDGNV